MKQIHQLSLVCALCLALPNVASAACFADYKAKQDDPLRLHYGIAKVNGACDARSAAAEIQRRLSSDGWTLLNVLSVFDDSGLQERKQSAGRYFLRY